VSNPRVRSASLIAAVAVLSWCAATVGPVDAAPPAPGKRGRLAPPPHSVSRDNLERARARLVAGTTGSAKPALASAAGIDSTAFVVLRIEFPDLAFGASPPADELHDAFYYENQFRYVGQYFDAASKGRLRLRTDIAPVVAQAAAPAAAYGDVALYDSLMVELVRQAVVQSDPVVDFAAYEGVLLVHAGPGQESDVAGDSPTQIWSGFLDDGTFQEQLSDGDSTVLGIDTADGVQITNAVILPEWEVQDLQVSQGTRLGSLGVYCHEVGQRLGLIPLFDSSPSRFPDSQGLGNFDVMAYGLWVANGFIPSQPSAFNRVLAGWVDPIDVGVGGGIVELRDFERGAPDSTVLRVRLSSRESFLVTYVLEDPDGPIVATCSGVPTGPRRFFAFEDLNANCAFDYIDVDGNDVLSPPDSIDSYAGAEWDFFMTDQLGGSTAGGGYGLLVLHVDEAVLQDVLGRGSTNVQGDARRKAVDVEEADGIEDLDRFPDNPRGFGSADDYWRRGRRFDAASVPDSRSADGAPTGVGIELVALPDSTAQSPGGRAHVRVTLQAATAASPRRRAVQAAPQTTATDLAALPLGDGRAALVVPADDGRVLLLDADLNEAPTSDGDPATWTAWVTVPPELRGAWAGPPAVGDVDGDGAPDVVLCANTDSAGVARARVFAWRRDGREVRDTDSNPGTNTGLLASFRGTLSAPALFPYDNGAHDGIVVVHQPSPDSVEALRLLYASGSWVGQTGLRTSGRAGNAPIAARLTSPRLQAAYALVDSADGEQLVVFEPFGGAPMQQVLTVSWTLSPVWLASGDLDADQSDDVVIVGADGSLWTRTRREALDAAVAAPPALADIDGDGTVEVLITTHASMHVRSATAASMPGWPYRFGLEPGLSSDPEPGRTKASPLAADLDGDGRLEILSHLRGGALCVWSATGERRRDLEASLPAFAAGTPVVHDLDGDGTPELAAIGRFDRSLGYSAGPESLTVAPFAELAVWSLPAAATEVAWGELGGGPGHAFRDDGVHMVVPQPNDPGLAGFIVGPNPARDEVRARIALTQAAQVKGVLYNLEGQVVAAAQRDGAAGTIVELVFDTRGLASGVYLTRLELSTGGQRVRPVALRR
jgi:M6 family metalloprotease-like protein